MDARARRDIETGGIVAIYGLSEAANLTYFALAALQHRGIEASGIAATSKGTIRVAKGYGFLDDVFDPPTLSGLDGSAAVGRNGYGPAFETDLQPVVGQSSSHALAIVKDGTFVNAIHVRSELENFGRIFPGRGDSHVLLHLLLNAAGKAPLALLTPLYLALLGGAYSLAVLADRMLIVARDPRGVRPLVIGSLQHSEQQGTVFTSETGVLDLLGADYVGEVPPGGTMTVSKRGSETNPLSFCAFEHIRFARNDSRVFGRAVAVTRDAAGRLLAGQGQVHADCVIAANDSAVSAAIGYAEQSGIPYRQGFYINHSAASGSTIGFPGGVLEDFRIKLSNSPIRHVVSGNRVVLVLDCLVRSDLVRRLVRMLRSSGAREVHVRSAAPAMITPCPFGIETPDGGELIVNRSLENAPDVIEADSLICLSMKGLREALDDTDNNMCYRCMGEAGLSDLLPTTNLQLAHRTLWDGPSKPIMSVFISYGGPDEVFANQLEEALTARGAQTFFFKKHAPAGEKIHRLVRDKVNSYDRMVLVCSRQSLDRKGVLAEIEAALEREAREGGTSVLIPIRLDDYVLNEWMPDRPDLVRAITDRVVADFRDAEHFDDSIDRLLMALRRP